MDEKGLVKKSNLLINSKYNLSKTEQKLILLVVSKVDKDDEDFKPYLLQVKDVLDLLEAGDKHYEYIKSSFKGLLSKPLSITLDNGNLLICNWLSSAECEKYGGYVEVCFDPKLKPFLLKLKECFTRYELKNILQFSGQYSIRIYEMLKQFEKTKIRLIDLDDLKNILYIPSSYSLNKVKSRILAPAKSEINEFSDIIFHYDIKKIKKGRYQVKFIIKSRDEDPERVHRIATETINKMRRVKNQPHHFETGNL
jgi:plasmid replication initiation protein